MTWCKIFFLHLLFNILNQLQELEHCIFSLMRTVMVVVFTLVIEVFLGKYSYFNHMCCLERSI